MVISGPIADWQPSGSDRSIAAVPEYIIRQAAPDRAVSCAHQDRNELPRYREASAGASVQHSVQHSKGAGHARPGQDLSIPMALLRWPKWPTRQYLVGVHPAQMAVVRANPDVCDSDHEDQELPIVHVLQESAICHSPAAGRTAPRGKEALARLVYRATWAVSPKLSDRASGHIRSRLSPRSLRNPHLVTPSAATRLNCGISLLREVSRERHSLVFSN